MLVISQRFPNVGVTKEASAFVFFDYSAGCLHNFWWAIQILSANRLHAPISNHRWFQGIIAAWTVFELLVLSIWFLWLRSENERRISDRILRRTIRRLWNGKWRFVCYFNKLLTLFTRESFAWDDTLERLSAAFSASITFQFFVRNSYINDTEQNKKETVIQKQNKGKKRANIKKYFFFIWFMWKLKALKKREKRNIAIRPVLTEFNIAAYFYHVDTFLCSISERKIDTAYIILGFLFVQFLL